MRNEEAEQLTKGDQVQVTTRFGTYLAVYIGSNTYRIAGASYPHEVRIIAHIAGGIPPPKGNLLICMAKELERTSFLMEVPTTVEAVEQFLDN